VIVRGVSLVVADRTILRDITFTASAGEITAIVGPNGVGKTTLLRAIDGYVAPSAGTIAHDERDLRALGSRERATTIASIASDGVSPEGMTLREVALMGRYARRRISTSSMARSLRSVSNRSPSARSRRSRAASAVARGSPSGSRKPRPCCSSTSRRAISTSASPSRCSIFCAGSREREKRSFASCTI
jgi:ABC-type branched-subunit amino acid transport system ATPase component